MKELKNDPWAWTLGLFAVGNLANAAWMLADPLGWYHGIPAAVPDFGPANEHFIRDVGAAFAMMGLGLAWATVRPAVRLPVMVMVSLFYLLHAAVHVLDTARGLVPPSHWMLDFPAVYLPAILLVAVTVALQRYAARQEATAAPRPADRT